MAVAAKIRKALDLKKLRLPPSPVVNRLEVEDYTDWTGDPALRVLLVIDEATDVDHINGADVSNLKAAIRESLQKNGISLFPYIFVAKPSELAENGEE